MGNDCTAATDRSGDADLGLDDSTTEALVSRLKSGELAHVGERLAQLIGENRSLRQQLVEVAGQRDEVGRQLVEVGARRDELRRQLDEVGELIESKRPDKLMHDLRNVLNELVLLRAALSEEL